MIGPPRNDSPLSRLAALAVGLAAVVLAGAATVDSARSRFLLKSAPEREHLRETLRRYDLNLTQVDQKAVRDLDARIGALPDEARDEYLSVLRRYHNWLRQLPERARDEVLGLPADARLKRIKELAAKYPPPSESARASLDFIQIGGTGAFELASLCKTWLALSPEERRKVDGLPIGERKDRLVERGREMKIPRELRPADYDEGKWFEEVEARIKELRNQSTGPKDWLSRIEGKFEQAAANHPEGGRPRPMMRRLAVNLYVEEHVPEHPVDPARLSAFYAATPPWIQSTFAAFPADEVRKRLGVVYRILYPFPEEFRSVAPATAPKAKPAPPVGKTPKPVTPKPPTAAPF